jgi:hypothetical protein
MPIIPALRRLKQENPEIKASLGYIVKPCVSEIKQINKLINFFLKETVGVELEVFRG